MKREASTVLITGVSQGIGKALLEEFAKGGWSVWGTIRSYSEQPLRFLDRDARSNVTLLPLDLSDANACGALKSAVNQPIDVLINCAATFGNQSFHADSLDPADFANSFMVNAIAPTLIARALKSRILESRKRLIIMMSTGNASLTGNTSGSMLSYRASKCALNQVVRTLAAEWTQEGITTVALNPGWVKTRMGGEQAPLSTQEAASNIKAFIERADASVNGKFLNTDGSALPW